MNQNESQKSAMLSAKEVSEELGVSLALVYREIQAGRLRVHRFGKRTYRVSRDDLDAYIAKSKQPAISETAAPKPLVTPPSSQDFKHIDISRLLSERS